MHAADLKPSQFGSYPHQAKELAVSNLQLLCRLPDVFVPILLQEVITYDWKFPAERKELENQFHFLASRSEAELAALMAPLAPFTIAAPLEHIDWVKSPADFTEALAAYLWTTHQIDAFTAASEQYAASLRASLQEQAPEVPRLVMIAVGQGVGDYSEPLFAHLRPYGVHFQNVRPEDGMSALFRILAARAEKYPENYAHWCIDGGAAIQTEPGVSAISYPGLDRARQAIVRQMAASIGSGDAGPEGLRSTLARMKPQDVGLDRLSHDPVIQRFQLSLLTAGSGTQIFSTTFVQWAAREVLRRAQPSTLLVRFAPRQRQQSFEQLLAADHAPVQLDPVGSLIDAEMGAYYTWLNLRRLSGGEQSGFLVWFEGHSEAIAIARSLPGGTQSPTQLDVAGLLNLIA
jgi:hypothetical protein